MATKTHVDDVTRRAQAHLYFRHLDRMSELVCRGDVKAYSLAVKHAQTLVSPQLDHDPNYGAEMDAVIASYEDGPRPDGIRPQDWRLMQRQEELECIHRNACREGVFKEFRVELESEPL